MIRLQNLRKMRIVDSHQRAPLQLCEVIGQPERNQRDGNSAVFKYSPAKVQVPACISKIRLNQPEHIPATRKDHPAAHYDQSFAIPLQVARKQQGKGNQPVEDKVQRDDVSPSAAEAIEIPGNFFREIAAPDDEELGEGQVDIEHDEGEGELAQVVLFSHAQDGLIRLGLCQTQNRDDDQCEHGVALADKEKQPVDRRVPGRIQ